MQIYIFYFYLLIKTDLRYKILTMQCALSVNYKLTVVFFFLVFLH